MLNVLKTFLNKGWPDYDAKMRSRELVNIFIQGHPFKLKRLANEKKLDTNPTLEERVFSFEILENYINRKHIANEMTPEPSDKIYYMESTRRYQHHA